MAAGAGLAIGIDLGTTNSCVAIVRDGKPQVLPDAGGYRTTPSMIATDEAGELCLGHRAKARFLTDPQATIYGFKRLLGRTFDTPEMEDILAQFFYPIRAGSSGEPRVHVAGRWLRIEHVAALFLRHLKNNAERFLGAPIESAVISVPAYFTQPQREAVTQAGALAGLRVQRVVNEPTAAAIAYGMGITNDKRIMVYDLGGGTFDVTAIHIARNLYVVEATGGNSYLGGIDFDNRLVDYLGRQVFHEHSFDLSEDLVALQRLRDAAEAAKRDLSTAEEAEVVLPYLFARNGEPVEFRTRISRQVYNRMVQPIVDRTIETCAETLAAAHLDKSDIDDLIFVGGMTRSPIVNDAVTAYFGKQPRKDVHPDEVVALGAAILADAMARNTEAVSLVDVVPVSIGVDGGDGVFERLIVRNTPIPARATYKIRLPFGATDRLAVNVYQGEHDRAADNAVVGELVVGGNVAEGMPAPKISRVDLQLEIDQDAVLLVQARDPDGGGEYVAQFLAKGVLRQERYRTSVRAIVDADDADAVEPPPAKKKRRFFNWGQK